MRWLGIDHGTKRIGLAISDPDGKLASPLDVVPAQANRVLFPRILALADEYDATGLVVGWPLNMDDTEGPQAIQARQFALELAQASGMDVRLWDERLTSHQADGQLAGLYTRKQKKARQDALAAAAMLQDFLDRRGPATACRPEPVLQPPTGKGNKKKSRP